MGNTQSQSLNSKFASIVNEFSDNDKEQLEKLKSELGKKKHF
jgi:hypothetical protein